MNKMIRIRKVHIFFLLLAVILFVVFISLFVTIHFAQGIKIGNKNADLGSITLIIIDNETNLPVSDAVVYYYLAKERPYMMVDSKYIIMELDKFKTDNQGEITIPAKTYKIHSSETINIRHFYINLDIIDDKKMMNEDIEYKLSGIILNKELSNDVIFNNSNYSATGAFFRDSNINYSWDSNDWTQRTDFSTSFFRYDFRVSYNEDIKVEVRLARNIVENAVPNEK